MWRGVASRVDPENDPGCSDPGPQTICIFGFNPIDSFDSPAILHLPSYKSITGYSHYLTSQSCFFLNFPIFFLGCQTSIHGQTLALNSIALSIHSTIIFLHISTAATFKIHVSILKFARQDTQSVRLSFDLVCSFFFLPFDANTFRNAMIVAVVIQKVIVIVV